MQNVQSQPTHYERFSRGVSTTATTAAIAPISLSAIPIFSAGAHQMAVSNAAIPIIGGLASAAVMAVEGVLVIGMTAVSVIALVASIPMGLYAASR